MKTTKRLILLVVLLIALILPQTALAQGPSGDKYVFGGSYTLKQGEVLSGNLLVFGGIATLEDGSQVDGDVILAGGTLQANGKITGGIIATGGLVDLGETADVSGDVTTIAAQLSRAEGAHIGGRIHTGPTGPLQFAVPGGVRVPDVQVRFNPVWDALWFLFRSFIWATLAILVVLFLPTQIERVSYTAVHQPLVAWSLGLLTVIVLPLLLIAMAITIIGIPVSLLGALLLAIAWGYGLIALGTEVGKRLALILKQEWALAVEAGTGTFVLILVINSIDRVIPCVGWLVPVFVGMLGLGAVLLTRFGTQVYPPYTPLHPVPAYGGPPPAPPSPPVAPPYVPVIPPLPEAPLPPAEQGSETPKPPPEEPPPGP